MSTFEFSYHKKMAILPDAPNEDDATFTFFNTIVFHPS